MTDSITPSLITFVNVGLSTLVGLLVGALFWFIHQKYKDFDSFKSWVENKYMGLDSKIDSKFTQNEDSHEDVKVQISNNFESTNLCISKMTEEIAKNNRIVRRHQRALQKGIGVLKNHNARLVSLEGESQMVKLGNDLFMIKKAIKRKPTDK